LPRLACNEACARAKEDSAYAWEWLLNNRALIDLIIRKYISRAARDVLASAGYTDEDVFSEAMLIAYRALQKHDPLRGAFSTYCGLMISSRIKDLVRHIMKHRMFIELRADPEPFFREGTQAEEMDELILGDVCGAQVMVELKKRVPPNLKRPFARLERHMQDPYECHAPRNAQFLSWARDSIQRVI
jgi:hypothetical protein